MTPDKLRDVARDAESDTHSGIWDYPSVLRDAADEIERLQAALARIARPEALFVATSKVDPEAYARMLFAQQVLDGGGVAEITQAVEAATRARYLPELSR